MSGTLIMLKGLPGSGKSTLAQKWLDQDPTHKTLRVNKDTIREQMLIKTWNRDVEKEVLKTRDFQISQGLSKGWTVVSDDTNFAPAHEARLRELAKKYKSTFILDTSLLTTPIEDCVVRDHQRGLDGGVSVGEKVIRDMGERYLTVADLVPRTVAPGKKQVFCDLDGVLADFDGFIASLGIVNDRENEDPDFWDKIRALPAAIRLYYDMKPMPGAKDLWARLAPFKPIILTGVPWSITSAAFDKRQWVEENVDPDAFVVCCKSRNKRLYMKPGDILIDDWTRYQSLWESAGGTFILYTGDNVATTNLVAQALNPTPVIMEGSPKVK